MIVRNIIYSNRFKREVCKLPKATIEIAFKKEKIFKINPLHPSLRVHGLKGRLKGIWSISISESYRILFQRMPNGDIVFFSIGKHDIYKYLN